MRRGSGRGSGARALLGSWGLRVPGWVGGGGRWAVGLDGGKRGEGRGGKEGRGLVRIRGRKRGKTNSTSKMKSFNSINFQ